MVAEPTIRQERSGITTVQKSGQYEQYVYLIGTHLNYVYSK